MSPIFPTLALGFVLATGVRADPGLVVTLANVGDRVRAQNPDLAAARWRIQEAAGRLRQAGRLSNPELEFGFDHGPDFRERKIEFGFNQRFPVTGRLGLEKSVSATELKASDAEVREVERRLIAAAREGVVRVLAIRERRELLNRQSGLAGEFAGFLKEVAAKGERSALEVGQARLELAGMAVESRQLDAEEATTVGQLKPLLGMRPDETLMVSGRLPAPVAVASDRDVTGRPDHQAAALGATAAGQQVELEQARTYDDLEAGVFVGAARTEDAPEGHDTEGLVGLRLKIPLPLWNDNRGAIEEAEARKRRRALEVDALARTIRLEIEAAAAEMGEWAALLGELDRTLIPLAEEQVEAAETAVRDGQGEVQSVFRNREKLLQLHSSRLDALREFNLARVRHQAALGQP